VEEYTGTSPYVYCLDNPVKYLDPDGKKIILMGDQLQKKRLLEIYQKLTDDRLDYNVKTGEVYGFSATNLFKGPKTAQIRDMINQNGVARVVLDNANGSRMEFNPDELTNATNNTGIGSCTIFLNPGEKMELLVKDNTGRLKFMESPIERTAAHENSHALRAMKGIFRNPDEMVKHDPDWRIPGGGKIMLEELENMMEENRLFPEAKRVRYTPRGINESLPKSRKVNRQR
jgi:hypothetical protein